MNEYKLSLKKIIKHFHVINKHKFKVFCLCCKVGIPIQGLLHDLSKFQPVEFFESAKYYADGKYSPIRNCKEDMGYSNAWIHHKNHNKHHYEYWYDYNAKIESPIIPFKYVLEMICDSLAAGMVYEGKNWNNKTQINYWNRVKKDAKINPKIEKILTRVYEEISIKGINQVLKRKYIKEIYFDSIREE